MLVMFNEKEPVFLSVRDAEAAVLRAVNASIKANKPEGCAFTAEDLKFKVAAVKQTEERSVMVRRVDDDDIAFRVEVGFIEMEFNLEFSGEGRFDALLAMDLESKELCGGETRFALNGAKQVRGQGDVLVYKSLKFYFFLLKRRVEAIKDINFFITYGR